MNLIAVISFWDEDPADLRACVESLEMFGVNHVLACDGRYAAYPPGRTFSMGDQYQAIMLAGIDIGATVDVHGEIEVFEGNEVGKRQYMLDLAKDATTEDDFLLVCDSDYRGLRCDVDLKEALAGTEHDSAVVSFVDSRDPETGGPYEVGVFARLLFRARRDLRMAGTNHYTMMTDDGELSLIHPPQEPQPALDLRGPVAVEHLYMRRDPARRERQASFYERRDNLNLETP